jgi:hypothetical protein
MHINIIKSPLTESQLQDIANLYGKVDRKYCSLSFCSYLFNENPLGFSIHAFAYHNGKAVGCVALIPMRIDTINNNDISLKAEAFFIEPKWRGEWIALDDDELPIGLALPKAIYAYALKEGFPLIHSLISSTIGEINKFAGGCQLEIEVRESFLFINPLFYFKRESKALKQVLILFIALYQKLRLNLFNGFGHRTGTICTDFVKSEKLECELSPLTSKSPQQWSIKVDKPFCRWFFRHPYIKVYASGSDYDHFIVTKQCEYPNRVTEIVYLYSKDNSLNIITQLLAQIIHEAISLQACSVNYKHFNDPDLSSCLVKALNQTGFISKKTKLLCYINSNDEYYNSLSNLAYNQLFYIQF